MACFDSDTTNITILNLSDPTFSKTIQHGHLRVFLPSDRQLSEVMCNCERSFCPTGFWPEFHCPSSNNYIYAVERKTRSLPFLIHPISIPLLEFLPSTLTTTYQRTNNWSSDIIVLTDVWKLTIIWTYQTSDCSTIRIWVGRNNILARDWPRSVMAVVWFTWNR
jgi:hypothetical protein